MSHGALPTRLEAAELAVSTSGLRKVFGAQVALNGVDFTVPAGAVYVLVGPNGAGKTTLQRLLLNLIRPDGGTARVFGIDPVASGPAVRGLIGYVPERQETAYGWMRVGRLLRHHARYFPTWDEGYAARLIEALEIRLDAKFGQLSKGLARRVELVMALAHRPPLLLLDEPTDGLDPLVRDRLLGLLAEHLADTSATALISTHLVHEAERMGDHLAVLRSGELVAQIHRDDLHRRLRRYTLEVPAGWPGAGELLGSSVVYRNGSGPEVEWTVWGEEADVVARLTSAGATIREVAALNLEEAAISLLRSEGGAS